MSKNKTFRFLICLVALVACVQFTGVEVAFCTDSALETNCQDCMSCAQHPFTELSGAETLPDTTSNDHLFLKYSFRSSQLVSLNILRPPISF